eukprot:GEMP01047836.1.p1 GENE.GEMP01047836.1~~GEMP01047836.1.p1  ORF type:complete len:211 (+),score=34.92 GEMP01047836.1:38-670(+)
MVSAREVAVVAWGAGFWIAMLVCALHGLVARGIKVCTENGRREIGVVEIPWWNWLIFALLFVSFLVGEGYRALHQKFCAMTIRRAFEVARVDSFDSRLFVISQALAPLFAGALFHATRSRLIKSWVLVFGIVGIVLIVKYLIPAPWREFIDLSVASAMLVGSCSLIGRTIKSFYDRGLPNIDSEYPDGSPFENLQNLAANVDGEDSDTKL